MREQQPDPDAVRFTELWESCSPRIFAYACRHVGPEVAQEVVSETFLVAWRRLEQTATTAHGADVTVADRVHALARLAALSAKEREALLLVSWDGLTPAEAAQVAGCSVTAFQVRLHRARRRLHTDEPATGSRPVAPPQPSAPCDSPTVVLLSARRPAPAPTSPGMSMPR